MDKNSILIVLLSLQLMVTITSTAHHESNDLGAAASTFFGGLSPVQPNVMQMPEPDHEESEEEVTGNDSMEAGINIEDTDGKNQLGDGLNLLEDRLDVIDVDHDADLMNDDIDLMDMGLEKPIEMHQGHDTDHLSIDEAIDEINMDNVALKMDNMAPKMELMNNLDPKMNPMDKVASTKRQFPTLEKMHAQESGQYPTSYSPQANDEFSKYIKTEYTDGPQANVYSTYETTLRSSPPANKYSPYETTSTAYAPQANKKYYETSHDAYGSSMHHKGYNQHRINKIHYVPVIHLHKRNEYKQRQGQYNNRYPVRYVPVIHVPKKNDYKLRGLYNRYSKMHRGTRRNYYQMLNL